MPVIVVDLDTGAHGENIEVFQVNDIPAETLNKIGPQHAQQYTAILFS